MPQALTAPDASDTKANEKVIAMPILSAFVSQFSIDTISVVYEHVGPDLNRVQDLVQRASNGRSRAGEHLSLILSFECRVNRPHMPAP